MTMLIGIDIGGTNLRVGVVEHLSAVQNVGGGVRLIEETRFQADFSAMCKLHLHSPDQAWQNILNVTASAIESVRKKYPHVSAVGIGFPGFINPNTQKISQSPNLPGLNNVDLSADLSKLIQLPVVVENDALAAAYGEFVMLDNKTVSNHLKNLIYIGLGTGVGGGLILNGQPFQGQHGVAMEIGHIIVQPNGRLCGCGNSGCMEQYASASGVAISYFEATAQQNTAEEIASFAYAGNDHAIAAYATAGKALAMALASMQKVIDIPDVVIGGGMCGAWQLIEPSFKQQLTSDLIPALHDQLNIRLSTLGDHAGVIGAAVLAKR